MKFYTAKVADILRTSQRDNLFIMDTEGQMHTFMKLMGSRNYHKVNSSIPIIANIWYYVMTSFAKIQTLGEEYTGTIRIDKNNKIPSKLLEIAWLALYVGGEPMLDRFLAYSKKEITSSSLTNNAKNFLLHCIQVLKEEKMTFKKIHNALFYMDGKYYNISNRLAGIRYVLLREWLEDNSFTGSFFILGNLSLFYVLLNFVLKLFTPTSTYGTLENNSETQISVKSCILCGENIKSATSTPCGHIFCWNCIQESFQYQKACPICREEINPSRIIYLQNFL